MKNLHGEQRTLTESRLQAMRKAPADQREKTIRAGVAMVTLCVPMVLLKAHRDRKIHTYRISVHLPNRRQRRAPAKRRRKKEVNRKHLPDVLMMRLIREVQEALPRIRAAVQMQTDDRPHQMNPEKREVKVLQIQKHLMQLKIPLVHLRATTRSRALKIHCIMKTGCKCSRFQLLPESKLA